MFILMGFRRTQTNSKLSADSLHTWMRSFLGLASYYRHFVPGFAATASPMHALTKVFHFYGQKSVRHPLRRSRGCSPQHQFGSSTDNKADASGIGLGAVLARKQDNWDCQTGSLREPDSPVSRENIWCHRYGGSRSCLGIFNHTCMAIPVSSLLTMQH